MGGQEPGVNTAGAVAARSASAQPSHDRLPHIVGQGQLVLTVALAMNGELTMAPVDTVQPKRGHFAGAQPETLFQHGQDGEVPASPRPATVTTSEQTGHLLRG